MNDLRSLIKESKTIKEELVTSTTVRMPKELHSFIKELADQLTLSEQEVMLKIIEEGVKVAKEAIEDMYEEVKNNAFHLLNTNRKDDVNDHDYMVNNGIAAAFYNPCKFNIDRIKKGDVVFLYENSVGIVAYGKGSGATLKKDRYADKDECHYQELSDFHVLEKPISASEVKKILGRNVIFLKTMSGMPDGQKVLDAINGK